MSYDTGLYGDDGRRPGGRGGRHRQHSATWLADSLKVQELRRGYETGSLPIPGAPQVWPDDVPEDRWPEHQLPAIGIGSPGTVGEPEKDGNGYFRATWNIGIGITVSAATPAATHKLAKVYGAAIRMCLLQHRSLGGFAVGLDWGGETYTALGVANSRSQAIAVNSFMVTVGEVISVNYGPVTRPRAIRTTRRTRTASPTKPTTSKSSSSRSRSTTSTPLSPPFRSLT